VIAGFYEEAVAKLKEKLARVGGQVMVCFLVQVLEMALRCKGREMGKEVLYRDFLLYFSQLVAVAL